MRTKPYPWKCPNCGEREVHPSIIAFSETIEHDGRPYEIKVPDLEAPQCRNCGKIIMVDSANRRISEALRREAGLLTPEQIRKNRDDLRMTQRQMAATLGIAMETLSRWETGAQIQQRSLDRFLRTFFAFAEVRNALAHEEHLAELGVTVPAVLEEAPAP